jgi:triosephosphate isomerase
MRIPLIAGNWKMNNTIAEAQELAKSLVEFSDNFDKDREILICAPFTALYSLKTALKGSKIKLGAQNMHFEESGAYTGEVSPLMLKEIGVDYVLVGHSERRQCFNENDEFLNKKIKSALKHGIKPILCVGETLEQREANIEKETVKAQIIYGFKGIDASSFDNIAVAYEPVWAIGTGKTATSEQAQEMILHIRNVIKELYSEEISESIRIQYGGSVKASNTAEIMAKPDIDGALVGGASLKAEEFIGIINY